MKAWANIAIVWCALCGTVYGQVEQVVLLESFTNVSSFFASAQNQHFNPLVASYPQDVIAIRYHVGYPGPDPMYNLAPELVDHRQAYYGVQTIPGLIVNGVHFGNPGDLTDSVVQSAIGVTAPVELDLAYAWSDEEDAFLMEVVVQAAVPIQKTVQLRVAVVEKLRVYTMAPGSNGETEFPMVVRKLLPDAEGTTWALDMQPGETRSLHFAWTPEPGDDPDDFAVVAFMQRVQDQQMLQAATAEAGFDRGLDAAIAEVDIGLQPVCGNQIMPRVLLRNYGHETLESAILTYSVNDQDPIILNWEGELESLDELWIDLPTSSFKNEPVNELEAIVRFPNGFADQYPLNDELLISFDRAPLAEDFVVVELRTDAFGAQTTWNITDANGQVVASGGPYQNQAPALDVQQVLLNDFSCYTFTIQDAGGNGICCDWGAGQFQVTDRKNRKLISGGEFEDEVSVSFYHYDAVGVPEPFSNTPAIELFPNPAQTVVSLRKTNPDLKSGVIRVFGQHGQLIQQTNWPMGLSVHQIQIENWAAGIYHIQAEWHGSVSNQRLSVVR